MCKYVYIYIYIYIYTFEERRPIGKMCRGKLIKAEVWLHTGGAVDEFVGKLGCPGLVFSKFGAHVSHKGAARGE